MFPRTITILIVSVIVKLLKNYTCVEMWIKWLKTIQGDVYGNYVYRWRGFDVLIVRYRWGTTDVPTASHCFNKFVYNVISALAWN